MKKLNIINMLNEIANEEASMELMKNFELPTLEEIYEDEMNYRASINAYEMEYADWLMSHGLSTKNVHFEEILSFEDWMAARAEEMKKWMVIIAK